MKLTVDNCAHCGAEFQLRRADAIYCSNRCGNRARGGRHYAANKAKYVEKRLKMRAAHFERGMVSRAKYRAKIAGIPFDITADDVIIPDVCPVLGIKLVRHMGRKGYRPDSPSLDKIDPSKGYTKGNVRVISARANLLKSDATTAELMLVLKDLQELSCA